MAIAQGVNKQTRFKRQSAKGTLAVAGSGGQILRRTQSTIELKKDAYNSADEITSTQQLLTNRHGAKSVTGSINGLFSPGTYSDLIGALFRRDFAAVSAITGASITVAGSGPYTITRAAGSFLTDGIKIGMVVRLTAGSFNASNLNKNVLVTGVTALVITGVVLNGSTMVAEGPIASATVTVPGKVTYVAASGQTDIYYTFEEWHPDISWSEYFQDCRIGQAQINLPGNGNATVSFSLDGLDMATSASAYYSSPSSETTTGNVVASCGVLYVNGTAVATVTDLQFTVTGNQQIADPVVGNLVRPDVFRGKVMASGQFTAYFESGTIPAMFTGESAISILSACAVDLSANADFLTFMMSQVNVNSMGPQDGETGLKRTYQFVAEYNSSGGAALANTATTIQIHDSQAA